MPFLSVSFALGAIDPAAAEATCFSAGAAAITYMDERNDPIFEPAPGEFRLWPATRLLATFTADASSVALVAQLAEALGLPMSALRIESIADRAWGRRCARKHSLEHAVRPVTAVVAASQEGWLARDGWLARFPGLRGHGLLPLVRFGPVRQYRRLVLPRWALRGLRLGQAPSAIIRRCSRSAQNAP